jgi:16S rRNA (guanine527-N7)-methyltransferase
MAVAAPRHTKELGDRLRSALATLDLAATAQQRDRLLAYVALLHRWNSVHNLSGAHDPVGLLEQHVVDCLAIVPSLTRHAGDRSLTLLDAGTGAGLPAAVLAVMRPHWTITAVDSVGKKVAFLRQAVGEMGLTNLHPEQERLERMSGAKARFDVVTARAFSSLRHLVESTRHLIDPRGVWAAMKGQPSAVELSDLPMDCQLFHVEPLRVPGLDGQRCLVWIKPAEH